MVRNVQKEIYKIRELLNDDTIKSHTEICKILGIPISTFQRRMAQIKQEDLESLDIRNEKTKERLQYNSVERLKEAFELTSQVNREILLDKKQPAKVRTQSSVIFLETECQIFNNSLKGIVSVPNIGKTFEIKLHDAIQPVQDVGDRFDK